MSFPAFEVLRPRTLDAALESLARYGPNAQMVAGGTDLIPSMKQGLFTPPVLLDLKGIRELDFIRFDAGGSLAIGALARITTIVDSPVIAKHFPVLHDRGENHRQPAASQYGNPRRQLVP